jgi:glycine/D-amino acid oxidase-like deaminating enzyme
MRSRQTGLDVCCRGGLHLLLSEREFENRALALKRLHNQPGMNAFEHAMLDHAETKKLVPQIGPQVFGASFSPHDGDVNALRLLRALHVAFQALGGSYFSNQRVETIERGAGEFRLTGASAEIRAQRVVLSAGLGNARLVPCRSTFGKRRSGQIIVTEKVAPFMDYIVQPPFARLTKAA